MLFTSILPTENFYYLRSQFIIYIQNVKSQCKILRYYKKKVVFSIVLIPTMLYYSLTFINNYYQPW